MPSKPESIDAYLATLSADRSAALQKLRQTILAILPDAEECISYSMPAFRYRGHVVAGFLATKQGCSYYPFSGTTLASLATELGDYGRTKSALHFDPKRPLPTTLVRKLLSARVTEATAVGPAEHGAHRAHGARGGSGAGTLRRGKGRAPAAKGAKAQRK